MSHLIWSPCSIEATWGRGKKSKTNLCSRCLSFRIRKMRGLDNPCGSLQLYSPTTPVLQDHYSFPEELFAFFQLEAAPGHLRNTKPQL